MNERADVLVVGRLLADIYPNQLRTPLSEVTSYTRFVGGFAGNVATGLARLGVSTTILSRVGDDGHGVFCRSFLEKEGVDTSWLATDPTYRTALAFCEAWPPDHFPITYYRMPTCPDWEIAFDDFSLEEAARIPWCLLTGTGLARSPSRDLHFALAASRTETRTVLDLDWRPMLWEDARAYKAYTRSLLPLVDVVIGNESEFEALGGDEPISVARALLAAGPGTIVVKRGEAGVLALDGTGQREIAGIPVEVVNGLGAGDAFVASLLDGLLQGQSLAVACERGNAAGAIVASRLPCSDAMPTRAEVDRLLMRAASRGETDSFRTSPAHGRVGSPQPAERPGGQMLAPEGLKGVIPAIPTPFTADGSAIDEAALRRVVGHVIEGGVHGIMTTGGTGEFPHLSRDERRRVTEVVVSEAAGAVPVYAGTAACATWEAIALTEDAATAGADAAILTPPFYFRIPNEMLHRHFEEVATAGILPVVVYNNPLYTGNDLGPGLIAALMEIDNVVGLKQSNDDLGQLVEALRLSAETGRSLLTGIDSQFYAALSVGARGIFSTAAAIVPAEMVRLYDLVASGDHAAAGEQHRRLQPLNRFLEYDPGYVSPTKEALTMLGLDCGPVRRPLPDFPESERPALREALEALGGVRQAVSA